MRTLGPRRKAAHAAGTHAAAWLYGPHSLEPSAASLAAPSSTAPDRPLTSCLPRLRRLGLRPERTSLEASGGRALNSQWTPRQAGLSDDDTLLAIEVAAAPEPRLRLKLAAAAKGSVEAREMPPRCSSDAAEMPPRLSAGLRPRSATLPFTSAGQASLAVPLSTPLRQLTEQWKAKQPAGVVPAKGERRAEPSPPSPPLHHPPRAAGAGKLGLSFDGEKLDLAATVGEMAKKFDLEDDDMLDVLL